MSVHPAIVLGTLAGPREVILTVPGSLEAVTPSHTAEKAIFFFGSGYVDRFLIFN